MALRLRSLLRAAGRLPQSDYVTLRDTMKTVAKSPIGDDVLPARLCRSLKDAYGGMQTEGRLAFLSILSRQDVDDGAVREAASALLNVAPDDGSRAGALLRARSTLREALRPASERILERLAQSPDGLRFLVSLRADLLAGMRTTAASTPETAASTADANFVADGERERWRGLDASIRSMLSMWFDAGLLRLERLQWDATPAALLERLMQYERVHPFRDGWADLRRRTSGPGRRLFAFTHPRMPGVPIGGLLIKQVLQTLAHEDPGLKTFVTLSPVPGFKSWLEARLARRSADEAAVEPAEGSALSRFTSALSEAGVGSWQAPFESGAALEHEAVREALLSLCARYLCLATQRQRALDPVAAFHLRNGASLVAVHWAANPSERGLRESAGIMVSYEYVPQEIERRHSEYVASGRISASPKVWGLVDGGDDR